VREVAAHGVQALQALAYDARRDAHAMPAHAGIDGLLEQCFGNRVARPAPDWRERDAQNPRLSSKSSTWS
jgi:hypothetical protein